MYQQVHPRFHTINTDIIEMKFLRSISLAMSVTAALSALAEDGGFSFASEISSIAPVGQRFQVLGRVVNSTDEEVEGFTLAITIGDKVYTNDFDSRVVVPGTSSDITWPIDFVPEQTGEYPYTVTLTAGGRECWTGTGTVHVRVRRWVVEERTGTWCAACPAGIYVFEQLKEKMGDEFIGIALHTYGNDPMGVADYQLSEFTSDSSAPYTLINRARGCHPLNLEKELNTMARRSLKASFEAASCALSEDKASVTVNTSVMFDADYTPSSADLRIGYFIIENDVNVDSPEYSQKNGFAGNPESQVPGWNELPATIPGKDMYYQHVGRGYSGSVLGVPGSVPGDVKGGECYEYTHTFALPDNILKVENCKLVVMAIEARSKSVLNGIELPLNGSYTGIESVTDSGSQYGDGESKYYDLNGVSVDGANLRSGIYVELKNGKARKVVVR